MSQATIANRLSAHSSLYKHLTDQQITSANPVAGVKRPKTGNAGIGSGKSPTLSKRQVRMMLDAPNTKTLQGLRDRAWLHVFFYVGARCSEPTLLKVKDFGYDAERGGSVHLNSFEPFPKWISRSAMPRPGLVAA